MKRLWARLPRPTLVAILLIPVLLLIDTLCYQVTLPVEIVEQHGAVTFIAGSTHLPVVGRFAQPQSLQFEPHDPLVHEYQIDGSDSVNNRDLDTSYFQQIAGSPYYRLQAWMRDLDGTSRWRDLAIEANGQRVNSLAWPGNGEQVPLPESDNLQIYVQLQRPETPMALDLTLHNSDTLQFTLDRGHRQMTVVDLNQGTTLASAYFPVDTAPFAAMFIDTLARILLWAIAVLLTVQACEMVLGWLWRRWSLRQNRTQRIAWPGSLVGRVRSFAHSLYQRLVLPFPRLLYQRLVSPLQRSLRQRLALLRWPVLSFLRASWQRCARLFRTLHPVAWLALAGSLVYVIWIALVEYAGQPHIYDDNAYLFAAKTYASGRLFAPAPPTSTLFPGPFMVIFQGRWFAQYEPGTALTLTPGVWLGVPWLVEPLLGTLALLGIGLIAARLYDRRVATLAVVLGCLSPFYSYLAASYLSHTIALFYLVWGLWALLRFAQGEKGWNMLLCGVCFGMAVLTRDLVALLFIVLLIPGVVLVAWRTSTEKHSRLKRLSWWAALLVCGLAFSLLYMAYNVLLTGDSLVTPRSLFFPADVWGFGPGIGFYGQHTLAAGFVNLDQLLTSLQTDLFGWPFYLTLVFVIMPFLTGRARKADWFLLLVLVVTAGSYIGYFYNGIYLGPRYLFEDLPFLLILSARGILTLGSWSLASWQRISKTPPRPAGSSTSTARPAVSLATLVLVSGLVLCNLIYYTPRQVTRYQNYTGLPDLTALDTSQIYHSPLHNAVVVTDNLIIYQQVLFALNDPTLQGNIIYAWGYTMEQLETIHQDFPDRAFYMLVVYPDGSVHYIHLF